MHLKDFTVSWKDFESHLEYFDEVLTLINEADLSVKLKKCEFL